MPRYFFNIVDGQAFADPEGMEMVDFAAARDVAIETAGAMLTDAGRASWNGTDWQMNVTDADQKTILRLGFTATEPA
jgi:hypothetical protein